jgi:hypothetical protein
MGKKPVAERFQLKITADRHLLVHNWHCGWWRTDSSLSIRSMSHEVVK